MAEFLRPEAKAALTRWREVILAAFVGLVGLWLSQRFIGIVAWMGWAVLMLALVWAVTAWRAARFKGAGGGPGIVHIIERRISYFGPVTGGIVDLDQILRIEIEPESFATPHWIVTGPDGQRIEIPFDAEGTDALFDQFMLLPGLDVARLIAVRRNPPPVRTILWRKTRKLTH